jgi:hypothetical protein
MKGILLTVYQDVGLNNEIYQQFIQVAEQPTESRVGSQSLKYSLHRKWKHHHIPGQAIACQFLGVASVVRALHRGLFVGSWDSTRTSDLTMV